MKVDLSIVYDVQRWGCGGELADRVACMMGRYEV